jgi:membrane associated rhomboid family serine protease
MPHQDDHGPPLFTFAMMAVFIAFFGAQLKQFDLSNFYAFPWRVADGQIWRLITCTFLHGDFMHIAFNAYWFLRFTSVIDNWLGPWAALLLYALVASSCSAAQLLVSQSPWGVVGVSGVVYGLFGFLWVMSRRRDDAAIAADRHTIQMMLGWLVVCFVLNSFGGSIGNTAHVVGLLLGWLVGQVVVARRKWRVPLALATLVVWAVPIALTQRPVWDRTLAHLPGFATWFPNEVPAEVRQILEDPAHAPEVGLIKSQHRGD